MSDLTLEIPGPVLRAIFSTCSKNDVRACLNGVYLDPTLVDSEEPGVTFVATNGSVMARYTVPADAGTIAAAAALKTPETGDYILAPFAVGKAVNTVVLNLSTGVASLWTARGETRIMLERLPYGVASYPDWRRICAHLGKQGSAKSTCDAFAVNPELLAPFGIVKIAFTDYEMGTLRVTPLSHLARVRVSVMPMRW